MKRSANDPSRHSFNGHTRRALGTRSSLAARRMWEGGEVSVVGKKGKIKKQVVRCSGGGGWAGRNRPLNRIPTQAELFETYIGD